EIFIRPYNEKVWTVGLDEMNCDWVVGRVPKPMPYEERKAPLAVFRYPADTKGIGEVWKRIARKFPQKMFHFDEEVVDIDRARKEIHTLKGTYPFDAILSTIPIVTLGEICKLEKPIDLKYSKVLLVGIGLKYPQSDWAANVSWAYYPRPETIFYRCTFISNFNEMMTPDVEKYWSVLCEIGLKADEEFDEREVVRRTIEDLEENGIIADKRLVVNKWLHVLPFGYPIPTLNREAELKRCQQIFEDSRIFSRGRFGGWRYECANQDHSFTVGQQFIDFLLFGTPENIHLI
uniref:Amino_oxidase domain-containing protein n=1 Tax=Steinernema glaseri TaxID=37863 RepID=A0A1I7Y142_9BILA